MWTRNRLALFLWGSSCLFVVNGWVLNPARATATTAKNRCDKNSFQQQQQQRQRRLLTHLGSATEETQELSTAAAAPVSDKPVKGSVVKIACRLQPEGDFVPEPLFDGIVLQDDDDDDERSTVDLQFVLGWGNYLPGLHDLVTDMRVGETRHDVSVDAGWGDVNPDLVATVPLEGAGVDPARIRVGTRLWLRDQDLPCTVTEVTDATFTVDANPPLAGTSYRATVTLKAVEAGTVVGPYDVDGDESSGNGKYETATFALGCFWGGELEFMRVPGVVGTAVGYTQGHVDRPTYQQVCTGNTGHTEAVLVVYDPTRASYETLVDVAMDRLGENRYLPNQVGNDKGTQYRHGVYYHTPAQKDIAEKVIASFGADCVTECKPATEFFFAEDYHQQYLLKGGQSARKGDTSVIRCYG